MINENEIMWEQFVLESPWLTPPLPDAFTVRMENLDLNDIRAFKHIGKYDQYDIHENVTVKNTEMYFLKGNSLAAYYRYSKKSGEHIQTEMTWNSPKHSGSFLMIFGEYIIPRFKIVESDNMFTSDAFSMWKKLIGAFPQYDYYIKRNGKMIKMTHPYDVYSHEEKFSPDGKNSTFLAIYKK
jgi:hypothetical protein